jgi:hypothetical protein
MARGRKFGVKLSDTTKEKMRLSAIERNKRPEYIQKLKDVHPSRAKKELWDRMCKDQANRMILNNPMKNPVTAKKCSESQWTGESIAGLHKAAFKLYGKKKCEICGISKEEYKEKHPLSIRLSMHCRDKIYTNFDQDNWVTVCEYGCHQKMDRLDR